MTSLDFMAYGDTHMWSKMSSSCLSLVLLIYITEQNRQRMLLIKQILLSPYEKVVILLCLLPPVPTPPPLSLLPLWFWTEVQTGKLNSHSGLFKNYMLSH